MKLKYHGYQTETVKRYEMSMGDLLLTISQGLISKNATDLEIRLVDCFMGDVEKFENLNALLVRDWAADWRVSVYQICVMHDNKENRDYVKVIFSDNVEMMEDENDAENS